MRLFLQFHTGEINFRWLQHDCPGRKESITKLLESFDPQNPAFEEVDICSEIIRRVPSIKENQEARVRLKESVKSMISIKVPL